MKKILPLLMLLLASGVYAQDTTGKKPVDTNSVIIHKDPRLDLLVKKQAQINEVTSRDSRRTDKGFRLMIISTNSRFQLSAESRCARS